MGNKSRVEVLVAAVQQDGEILYKDMRLNTDAVIAIQGENYKYEEKTINGKQVKIIETSDRGVGKNRNISLLNAGSEFLLFSDEDIVYHDDYEKKIVESFERHPDADILLFCLNFPDRPKNEKKVDIKKERRAFVFNTMRFGTPNCAIRRESLLKANLWFSLLYGGGAPYASGEDSLFFREALKKKLKIYTVPCVIADMKQKESSWFHGYNDKYFRDKGVLAANLFPVLYCFFIFVFSWKAAKKAEGYSFFGIWRLMNAGAREYKGRTGR